MEVINLNSYKEGIFAGRTMMKREVLDLINEWENSRNGVYLPDLKELIEGKEK